MSTAPLLKINPHVITFANKYGIEPLQFLEALEQERTQPAYFGKDNGSLPKDIAAIASELRVPPHMIFNLIETEAYYAELSRQRCGIWS